MLKVPLFFQLHLAFFCIYWLQYTLNFIIYAAKWEPYRRAYVEFLNMLQQSLKKYVLLTTNNLQRMF